MTPSAPLPAAAPAPLPGGRLRRALGSVKWRITLAGIAALALGICLITVLLVQRAEHHMRADWQEREVEETARTAAILSSRVVQMQQALRLAAEQLDEPVLHDRAALERFLAGQTGLRSLFNDLMASDARGRALVVAERAGSQRLAFDVADRAYFQQTLVENRPIVSEPLPSRAVAEPVIVLTHPLRGRHGVFGLLAGGLRLGSGDLMAHVLQHQGGGERGALLLVTDLQGRVLAHPDAAQVMQPLQRDPLLQAAWEAWTRMRAPLEPSGVAVEVPGAVVSVAAVSGPQWLVWRVLPERQVVAPLRAAWRQALGWTAVLVSAMSVLLYALMAWQLRPLQALGQRARHLFDAAQDPHEGWPAGAGEVGELARVLRHVGAERARLESFNGALLRQLESVMATAPVGIAFTHGGRFVLVNQELCRLLGRETPALAGQPVAASGLDPKLLQRLRHRAQRSFERGVAYREEWQLRRADGSAFWADLGARPADVGDVGQGWIWTVSDISAQVAARAQLQWSAHHDPLTGLANRAGFEQRLLKVFAARPHSMPAALVALDLDHFKPINDTAGHAAGDAMLKAVAAAIRGCVRAGDMVARMGGDEFVLLLERCPNERALQLAGEVCRAVARIELAWDGARTLRVGASAGVAPLEADMYEVAHWLRAADRTCYEAKAAGRGQARGVGPSTMPPLEHAA